MTNYHRKPSNPVNPVFSVVWSASMTCTSARKNVLRCWLHDWILWQDLSVTSTSVRIWMTKSERLDFKIEKNTHTLARNAMTKSSSRFFASLWMLKTYVFLLMKKQRGQIHSPEKEFFSWLTTMHTFLRLFYCIYGHSFSHFLQKCKEVPSL